MRSFRWHANLMPRTNFDSRNSDRMHSKILSHCVNYSTAGGTNTHHNSRQKVFVRRFIWKMMRMSLCKKSRKSASIFTLLFVQPRRISVLLNGFRICWCRSEWRLSPDSTDSIAVICHFLYNFVLALSTFRSKWWNASIHLAFCMKFLPWIILITSGHFNQMIFLGNFQFQMYLRLATDQFLLNWRNKNVFHRRRYGYWIEGEKWIKNTLNK